MKTVVITSAGSLYGKKILNYFREQEIPVQAVIVIRHPATYFWKLFTFVHKRVGIIDAIYFSVRRLLHEAQWDRFTSWRGHPFISQYEHLGIPVIYCRGTNSVQTEQALGALSPDVLVLGQPGVVRENILRIPRRAVLNGHPGILPDYRGIDCAKWAVYHDDFQKVGSSVHLVDQGVDTDSVLATRRYTFKGSETLGSLDDHLYDLCVELLADVVRAFRRGDDLPGTPQNRHAGKRCYKMSRKHERIAELKLKHFQTD